MYGYSFNMRSKKYSTPTVSIPVPQDLSISEVVQGDVVISWTDATPLNDGHKVYRRLTNVGGSWGTALSSIANGVEVYTDSTIVQNTQYDYKVVSYSGLDETTGVILGQNYNSITTQELVIGLKFENANNEYIILNSGTIEMVAPWSIKLGIQEMGLAGGTVGPFGYSSGSSEVVLFFPGTPQVKMVAPGVSLRTSPTLSDMDLVSRKIIEYSVDAAGDVYYTDFVGATPQYMFNIDTGSGVNDWSFNIVMRCSSYRAEGYLYYMEYDNNGTIETFDINEGSGTTIAGSLGSVFNIVSGLGQPHIDNNMWNNPLPTAPGYVPFTSLSVPGRSMNKLLFNLLADPSSYTVGTVDYNIASIYNIGNHNPEGYSHVVIPIMTNDIANVSLSAFQSPADYETSLLSVVQLLKGIGITPVLGTAATMDTPIAQAAQNYDDTIGAMLSGDPMNPTPESEWNFNTDLSGTVTAVTPLYVAKMSSVATAESILYYDALADFISNGTPTEYSDAIGGDGIHYGGTGYPQYGEGMTAILDTLVVAPTKIAVLGDSLGNGITTALNAAYN